MSTFLRTWLRFLPIVLCSCAQVEVILPNPRVETPEARAERGKWTFNAAFGGAHVYKTTENGGERPPDLTKPNVRGHAHLYPSASYSLADRLEVGGEVSPINNGVSLFSKFQLFGEGTPNAKKGNIPLAVFARAGTGYGSRSGDQTSTFGDGGYNWSGKVNGYYVQGGVSSGYRVSDMVLFYGGIAVAQYWTRTSISQDPNGTDPVGGSYKASQNGDGKTGALGIQFGWSKLQCYISGAYSRIDYGPTNDLEDLFFHTGVQFTP